MLRHCKLYKHDTQYFNKYIKSLVYNQSVFHFITLNIKYFLTIHLAYHLQKRDISLINLLETVQRLIHPNCKHSRQRCIKQIMKALLISQCFQLVHNFNFCC